MFSNLENRALAALIEIANDETVGAEDRVTACSVLLHHHDATNDREFAKTVQQSERCCRKGCQ